MMKQLNKNYKETIPELISKSGAIPGIKVDTGAKELAHLKKKKSLKV